MNSEKRRGSLLGPVLLIGAGIIFLLENIGILSINVWDVLFRMWPVILIAVGLDLLIGRRSTLGSMVALVLIVAVLVGGVWLLGFSNSDTRGVRTETVNEVLDGVEQATIRIEPGVGALHLDGLEPSHESLIYGTVVLVDGQRLDLKSSMNGSNPEIRLRSAGNWEMARPGQWLDFSDRNDHALEWNLGISPDVLLDLDVELGVGENDLDLSDLQLESLSVELGIGASRIILPKEGEFPARIEGAIGETVVLIPQSLPVRVTVDTGLATAELRGFSQEGNYYYSPGAKEAGSWVELTIEQALGNMEIRVWDGD
jgi:hypothetical protein